MRRNLDTAGSAIAAALVMGLLLSLIVALALSTGCDVGDDLTINSPDDDVYDCLMDPTTSAEDCERGGPDGRGDPRDRGCRPNPHGEDDCPEDDDDDLDEDEDDDEESNDPFRS